MSFAVLHLKKMKQQAVKGMQIHNQREKESETNKDIDPEKKHLNYDLVNDDLTNYNERITGRIEEGVTTGKKVRKDAVRLCSFLVTSDKDFFDNLTEDDEKKFFESSLEFFKEKYGEENIVYGSVHKDEKTPHMHVGFVPVTEDGRLSAKDFFGRKSKMYELQDEFHAHVKENGFDLDRGVSSDRSHIETSKFKHMTLQQENEKLGDLKEALEEKVALAENKAIIAERKLEKVENAYETKDRDFKALEKDIDSKILDLDLIDKIEKKKLPYRDWVAVRSEKLDEMSKLARVGVIGEQRTNTLSKDVSKLQKANEGLLVDLERERNQIHMYENKNRILREEKDDLERENKNLFRELTDVKHVAAKLKELGQMVKNVLLKMGQQKFVKEIEKKENQIERDLPSKKYEQELDR